MAPGFGYGSEPLQDESGFMAVADFVIVFLLVDNGAI